MKIYLTTVVLGVLLVMSSSLQGSEAKTSPSQPGGKGQQKTSRRIELPYRLPADYPAPREILRKHFPRTANQCCFKGGWGYDPDHATIILEFDPEINPDKKFDGVSLEYGFIDKRIREELIFARPEGKRFAGIGYKVIQQQLLQLNGVPHDRITVQVIAYPEKEWDELKADWDAHNGYKDDPAGRKANLQRKEAVKLTYRTEFWFNIKNFFPMAK